MGYDNSLADQIRSIVALNERITEKKMFGGIAFLHSGNMACGVAKDKLMLRLGNDAASKALKEPFVIPMDFTGKPIRSMVYVEAEGISTKRSLRTWIDRAIEFAETLPPK
jgi:TfoX/Sxy family transcriptional regulator of competence genes